VTSPSRRRVLAGLTGSLAAALAGCARPRPPSGAARRADGETLTQYRYGDAEAQVADLRLPGNRTTDAVVVLVHGGYWQAGYDRSLEDAVAADLVGLGWPVWNLDYRTVVGHSAGGTLALWAAGRHRLPTGAAGADPVVRPVAAVTQAGINDLAAGACDGLGGNAVESLLEATPDDDPGGVYALTSPAELVPLGVPTLVVTGEEDTVVPPEQSTSYAKVARAAGDEVTLEVVGGEGHFEHLDPSSQVWATARAYVTEHLA
jgi:acetyl esterase/lipase